jgi:hypothetical protein
MSRIICSLVLAGLLLSSPAHSVEVLDWNTLDPIKVGDKQGCAWWARTALAAQPYPGMRENPSLNRVERAEQEAQWAKEDAENAGLA